MKFGLVYLFAVFFLVPYFLRGQDINTIVGSGSSGFCGDGGLATSACIDDPSKIFVDKKGNIFIADRFNNRIRKVNTSGIITTIAGTGVGGYSGDGGPAISAELNFPSGITVDKIGNIYIADENNYRLRKVDTFGIISTIAGTGVNGYNGDSISADTAQVGHVVELTTDSIGNVVFSDNDNRRVRKIDMTSGVIYTIVGTGTGGFNGDGGLAVNAEIMGGDGLKFDKHGNLFFADFYNNRIRMIAPNGIINTVAGDGGTGYSGDGGPATQAQMTHPGGLAIDKFDNIYIASYMGHNVRKFIVGGNIDVVAGTGTIGFSGDGGPALIAQMNMPLDVAVDTTGALYITDAGNNRIRKVDKSVSVKVNSPNRVSIFVLPNPSNGEMYISGGVITDKVWSVEIKDLTGRVILNQSVSVEQGLAKLKTTLPNGVYLIYVKGSYGTPSVQKIVVNN